jgi:hypothetical protein
MCIPSYSSLSLLILSYPFLSLPTPLRTSLEVVDFSWFNYLSNTAVIRHFVRPRRVRRVLPNFVYSSNLSTSATSTTSTTSATSPNPRSPRLNRMAKLGYNVCSSGRPINQVSSCISCVNPITTHHCFLKLDSVPRLG